jgi:hypothetical protein
LTTGDGADKRRSLLRPGRRERTRLRWVIAALIVVLGCLQAWESGILLMPAAIVVLVLLAILVPAMTALAPLSSRLLLASVSTSALLLLAAKRLSPAPPPSLLMIGLIGGFMLYGRWLLERRFIRRDGGDTEKE